MRKLFGTDGIRGVAGEYPLDRRTVLAIGRAIGARLKRRNNDARIVIGQDTRDSSAWIAEALAEGLHVSDVGFVSAGVLTTPGVAFLTHTHRFSAGIVISASHNPWQDNGIKLFGPNGMKLADSIEHDIEQDIFAYLNEPASVSTEKHVFAGKILPGDKKLRDDYIEWLVQSVDAEKLKGFRVLADCANGSASFLANQLFARLGIDADILHALPTGKNINNNCGALHPEHVADIVRQSKGRYDLGITFDGDADRALFCDRLGNVINGDGVMLLCARELKSRNLLQNDTVVATTMSNMGLEKALRQSNIKMLRANVGDKYVLEEMLKTGAVLGGEQSGHILFLDKDATTGDGLLTALRVLEVIAHSGKKVDELVTDLKVFPQIIKNLKVREKIPLEQLPTVMNGIRAAELELDGNGRVVVRYSGTEKLARVMIEAESEELMNRHAEAISSALQQAIGI